MLEIGLSSQFATSHSSGTKKYEKNGRYENRTRDIGVILTN